MAIAHHDRLDQILTTREYTDAPCGSMNKATHEAAYCSTGCPTLKARILRDEATETPINVWPPAPVELPSQAGEARP
jgi:hypothetical protein